MIHQELIIPIRLKTIATGDGKIPWEAPYAGEVIKVGGSIETLGSGSGTSTDIQLRNETDGNKDILSKVGAFEVDSANNLLEGAVVNTVNSGFAAGDVIQLDIDAISTSPANLVIYVTVVLFVSDL